MEFLASNRFWFMASGITTFLRVSGWTFSQHVSTPQVIILVHPLWSFFLIIFSVVLRACQDFRGDELWPRQRLRGTARVRGEKKGLLWHLGGCDTSWLWFPRSKPQQADRVEPDQPAEPQKAAIHWGFTWIHQVSRCFFFWIRNSWCFVTSHLNILAEVAPVPLNTNGYGRPALIDSNMCGKTAILQCLKSGFISVCLLDLLISQLPTTIFWKPNM